ncbi:DUF1778 domain-containing protein [Luteimonas huabeiensis]|uniref:type II toxin-antitoxin system TacA family antitoxin n=1 Tax=Luteimonas huabeiensis TaxID=1244513 RepID=UPI0004B01EA2|nr:DUF1778 domain-containing protein [Luteimonas huabeiensis]
MPTAAAKTINFRAPADKQALIDRAAKVSGKNRTEFILDASCEKAREVLADQTHFAVSRAAMQRFNARVEAPGRARGAAPAAEPAGAVGALTAGDQASRPA